MFGTAPTFTTSVTITGGGIIDIDGIDLDTGNDFQINNTSVLNATTLGSGVTASSLTSIGTLTGLTINSATVTLSQDTDFVLSGGVNGVSFDGTTLSIDATNNRIGIGTTAPLLTLDVAGSGRFTGTATSVLTGSIDPIASTTVTGVSTLFTTELVVGDRITVTAETRTVTAIASNTSLTVDTAFSDNVNDTSPDKLAAELIVRDSSNNIDFIIRDNGNVSIDSDAVLYNNSTGVLSIDSVEMGAQNFETNAGIVSWVDMLVTSGASVNTVESYSAQIDGNALLTIYSVSNGSGSIKNKAVGIGTTTPLLTLDTAGSARFTGTATSVLTGTIDPIASTTVTGVSTLFTTELVVGDRITVTAETRTVTAIASNTSLTVNTAFSDNVNDTSPDKLAAEFIVRDSSNNVDLVISDQGGVGIGTISPDSILLDVEDDIEIGTGTTGCVRDADNTNLIGTCVSDERLKKNITSFQNTIGDLAQLRPVTFE